MVETSTNKSTHDATSKTSSQPAQELKSATAAVDAPVQKEKKPLKPNSLRNQSIISKRVLSVVAFIISSAYILMLILDLAAEAMNYDLIPLQTLIYYMAPMFILLALAYVSNALATFEGHSWWNLISCVLYIGTMAAFPALWYCVALQCLLTFFSFFRMRKQEVQTVARDEAVDAARTPLVDTPNEALKEKIDEHDQQAKANKYN